VVVAKTVVTGALSTDGSISGAVSVAGEEQPTMTEAAATRAELGRNRFTPRC
jgi:hypothetical protein